MVWSFHYNIDLYIGCRTFSQEMRNITSCLRASTSSSPINIQINIKMEVLYHKSQQALPNNIFHFHFDIDLNIDWRTFSQSVILLLQKPMKLTFVNSKER
jgi:hypothetical protein